jgi:putative transposase
MLRGIERRILFRDDGDRADLLRRLTVVLVSCGIACFAVALMSNHVHLVLRTASIPLSRAMARLGTGYAGRFNRRHDRPGHLFQNRYKALLVDDDEYLRVLVRYVHLNPLRAGILEDVSALESYPWTGHASLMGRHELPFVAVDEVLALFGETVAESRAALRAWMSADVADQSSAAREPDSPSQSASLLIQAVAREFGVAAGEIRGGRKRREVVEARAVAAYLACDQLGLQQANVARLLGVGETAMERARARGRLLFPQGPPGLAHVVPRMRPREKE